MSLDGTAPGATTNGTAPTTNGSTLKDQAINGEVGIERKKNKL